MDPVHSGLMRLSASEFLSKPMRQLSPQSVELCDLTLSMTLYYSSKSAAYFFFLMTNLRNKWIFKNKMTTKANRKKRETKVEVDLKKKKLTNLA